MDTEDRLLNRIKMLRVDFRPTAERYSAMLEKRTGIDTPDAALTGRLPGPGADRSLPDAPPGAWGGARPNPDRLE